MEKFREIPAFGIAGNFAEHLRQAGEEEEFKDIETEDADAPKGIFPIYIPNAKGNIGVFPFCPEILRLPSGGEPVQVEPEVMLLCDIAYAEGKVTDIVPKEFVAFNDCSMRVPGASKISQKKNWGECSKGVSQKSATIDRFSEGGEMDRWRIASFVKRDGNVIRCGEDAALVTYSYFHERLIEWMIVQFNTQKDFSVLEDVLSLLKAQNYPKEIAISIGATRYTALGEINRLQAGDTVIVLLYNETYCCPNEVLKLVVKDDIYGEGMLLLKQEVVSG